MKSVDLCKCVYMCLYVWGCLYDVGLYRALLRSLTFKDHSFSLIPLYAVLFPYQRLSVFSSCDNFVVVPLRDPKKGPMCSLN